MRGPSAGRRGFRRQPGPLIHRYVAAMGMNVRLVPLHGLLQNRLAWCGVSFVPVDAALG